MSRLLRPSCIASIALLLVACGGGGGGGGGNGGGGGSASVDPTRFPDVARSEFLVTPAFGLPADGTSEAEVRVRLISLEGNPIAGAEVRLEVSGSGNVLQPLPRTDSEGRTAGRLASRAAERKTLVLRTESGGAPSQMGPRTIDFLLIPDDARFVRTSGSDANGGRSPLDAWRTLEHALAEAPAGATIHVGGGLHAGPVEVRRQEVGSLPLHVRGDRDGQWTGDAGFAVIEAGGAPWALRIADARHVVVDGLALRGAERGLLLEDSSNVLVLACRFEENDVGLEVARTDDATLQDCRISSNRGDGARIDASRRVTLQNALCYANAGNGLVLGSRTAEVRVRHSTFFRNELDHVREERVGPTGRIEECIFAESGLDAIALLAGTAMDTRSNLIWDVGAQGERETPDDSIAANPLFANPFGVDGVLGGLGAEDDDFRLLPSSVAIDLGQLRARDVLLQTGESLATRTTRSDGVLEHELDDGAATNLGYHTVPQPAAFVPPPPGGARFVHARPGDVRPSLRAWDPLEPNRVAGDPMPPTAAETLYLETRLSPLDSSEEILALQVDTGTVGEVRVRTADGRLWNDPLKSPRRIGIPRDQLADRLFDVEYMQLSGRALLVMADGDGIPSHRVLERGRWSPAAPVASFAAGAGAIRWVELVPRPGSDEVALVTCDDARDLVVSVWDGQAFGPPLLLETNTLHSPGWRPFDAAFESLSGDLLVAWGFNVFAEETRWATLERATATWRFGQHPNTDAVSAHVVLSPDPTSDRIAATMGEADLDNDVSVAMWSGQAWGHTAELTLAGPAATHLPTVAWIGDTGLALSVFRRQGTQGSFEVALFQPTGWRIQPAVDLPGVARAMRVELASFATGRDLLGTVLDENGKLFAVRFEIDRFVLLNGGQPLVTGLDPLAPARPFGLALRPTPAAD